MRRALELARQANGTSPNPPVGAVLVKNGEIVGEGFTRPPGGPHAERVALQEAGEEARGSTLYVTLEPCSHVGRTGPCTEAILRAGVEEVHVALSDPNPLVNGSGIRILAQHGVRVVEEPAEGAGELIEAHAAYTVKGRPFVALALGLTRDQLSQVEGGFDLAIASSEQTQAELVLSVSDRSNSSYLIRAGRDWQSDTAVAELLDKGLVDKIFAAPDLPLPSGFHAMERRGQPYVTAYRDGDND
jgi:riboflavin biosynthesis protein RibD